MTNRSDPRGVSVPTSRVGRLARIGALTAGVAGNMAIGGARQLGRGARPRVRDLLMTPANFQRITDQLAQMRGAAMKVGQMISMEAGEMLPPELSQILARLRADADFMPPGQLKKVLNAQWRAGWLKSFERFDVRPIAAASIGQVHRARLKDGRDLAIKVQYPGVDKSIDSDVANVGTLIRLAGVLPKGFDLAPYLEEARRQLHEETDYVREAECLSRFGNLLAEDTRFTVPVHHRAWSTDKVLSMQFLAGDPIEEMAVADQSLRDQIAHDLIDLLLSELFSLGLMQTDPNFANYRFDRGSGRIILLDFGATRALDGTVVELYRRLLGAGLARDWEMLALVGAEIGLFDDRTLTAHREMILRTMRRLFEGVTTTPVFDFGETDLLRQARIDGALLAEQNFMPPDVPVDVLYLQRKFGGIFLLATKMRARVAVAELLEKYLAE